MGDKCKCKRKVLLINEKETVKLSHTVITFEKLIMKVKNRKIKRCEETAKNFEEDYPIFRAQFKERIVPCCRRDECERGMHGYVRPNYKHTGPSMNYIEERIKKRQLRTPDKKINGLSMTLEDISSGSDSTDSDDEIDRLVKSTRKMAELGDGKKKPSGAQNRKNKLDKEEKIKKLTSPIDSFFRPGSSSSASARQLEETVNWEERTSTSISQVPAHTSISTSPTPSEPIVSQPATEPDVRFCENVANDPALWPQRMRNSDEDWILIRRSNRASSPIQLSDCEILSINTSFESLDTLILEPTEKLFKLKHEEYLPSYSPEIVDDKKYPDIKNKKIKVDSVSIDKNNFLINLKKECKPEDEIKAVVTKLEKPDNTASTASGFDDFKVKKELYGDL